MTSKNISHWYQRNNKVKPLVSCNVTSMCCCLDILGKISILDQLKKEYNADSEQPEDWLYTYLNTNPEIQKYLVQSHGTSEIPAPEWADCLIKGINTLAGTKLAWFDDKLELQEIKDDLNKDLPINVSTTLYGGGHRTAIVGIRNENTVPELLISDPWLTRAQGGVRWMTWDEFLKIRKLYGIRFNASK